MEATGVKNIVFSSLAVYGDATRYPSMIPILEACPISSTNSAGELR